MQRRVIQRSIVIGAGAFIAFYPGLAQAMSGVDAIQMLINLSNAYPALWRMLTGACYVIGFLMAIRAVYYLKVYGEMRTMMASQSSLKTPLALLIVAAVLIYIPTGFHVVSQTVFGYSSPLAYSDVTSGMNPVALRAITGLIGIIGLLAFIRGWMMLAASAEHPGGQAKMSTAIVHIIGGLLAMNILGVVDIIWNTFGFTSRIT